MCLCLSVSLLSTPWIKLVIGRPPSETSGLVIREKERVFKMGDEGGGNKFPFGEGGNSIRGEQVFEGGKRTLSSVSSFFYLLICIKYMYMPDTLSYTYFNFLLNFRNSCRFILNSLLSRVLPNMKKCTLIWDPTGNKSTLLRWFSAFGFLRGLFLGA